MLIQLSERVLIRRSAYCHTNTIAVLGPQRTVLLIDPGVDGADLAELAADIRIRGLRVVAGAATHPHWDHVLWHPDWGSVPRWATRVCAEVAADTRAAMVEEAAEEVPGVDAQLLGRLTPLPEKADYLPWNGPSISVRSHLGHAPGHAVFQVEPDGVLVVGDMLSDVEVPLLDLAGVDPLGDYLNGLNLLDGLLRPEHLRLVVPGHGDVISVAGARSRVATDRIYLDQLARGAAVTDPRLGAGAPSWLICEHRRQQSWTDRHRDLGRIQAAGSGRDADWSDRSEAVESDPG